MVEGAPVTQAFQGGVEGAFVRHVVSADGTRVELTSTGREGETLVRKELLQGADGGTPIRETVRWIGPGRAEARFALREDGRWTLLQTERLDRRRRRSTRDAGVGALDPPRRFPEHPPVRGHDGRRGGPQEAARVTPRVRPEEPA